MPKRRRLSRSAEFERVYRQGRSKANRFLVLYAFPFPLASSSGSGAEGAPATSAEAIPRQQQLDPPSSPSPSPSSSDVREDGPRLGLSVSRRVGGAVERTRVKRCLREAFWAEAERLPPGADYVIVARPGAGELADREGTPGLQRSLAELVDQLAGAAPRPDAPADPEPQ